MCVQSSASPGLVASRNWPSVTWALPLREVLEAPGRGVGTLGGTGTTVPHYKRARHPAALVGSRLKPRPRAGDTAQITWTRHRGRRANGEGRPPRGGDGGDGGCAPDPLGPLPVSGESQRLAARAWCVSSLCVVVARVCALLGINVRISAGVKTAWPSGLSVGGDRPCALFPPLSGCHVSGPCLCFSHPVL